MKKLAITLSLFLFAVGVFAQVSQNRNCESFTGMNVSGAINVIFTEDAVTSVKVVAKEEYQPKIITEVKNGILKIYTKDGNFNSEILVYVTSKPLNYIEGSGAVKIEGTNTLNADKLKLEASGASQIKLELKAGEVSANCSGASSVKLKGTANKLDTEISGASSIKANNLTVLQVTVSATGASHAYVYAKEKLTVNASGSSEVNYTGTPKDKNIAQSGVSRIENSKSEAAR